jgi:hypothetical protein
MTVRILQTNVAEKKRGDRERYTSARATPAFHSGEQNHQDKVHLTGHSQNQDQAFTGPDSTSSTSDEDLEYDMVRQTNVSYRYHGHYGHYQHNHPLASSRSHQPWTYGPFPTYHHNQHQDQRQGQGHSYVPRSTPAQETMPHWEVNRNRNPVPNHNQNDDGIIYEGEGVVLAGQSSDHFQDEWSLELCYQCCKRLV